MRLTLYLPPALLCVPALCFSQPREQLKPMPRQSAYVEALGAGLTYTLNYERFIYREPKFALGFRAGGGITPPRMTWAPCSGVIGLTALWGSDGELVEIGAYRIVLFDRFARSGIPVTALMFGYRYQPKPKGVLVKFGFTPFLSRHHQVEQSTVSLIPYMGASVGYGF